MGDAYSAGSRLTCRSRIGASLFFAGAVLGVGADAGPASRRTRRASTGWRSREADDRRVVLSLRAPLVRATSRSSFVSARILWSAEPVACNGEQHGDPPTMTEFYYIWPAALRGLLLQALDDTACSSCCDGAAYAVTLAASSGLGDNVDPLGGDQSVSGRPAVAAARDADAGRRPGRRAARDRPHRHPDRHAQPPRLRGALRARDRARRPAPASRFAAARRHRPLQGAERRFGHIAGDAALAEIGAADARRCRAIDTAGPDRRRGVRSCSCPATGAGAALRCGGAPARGRRAASADGERRPADDLVRRRRAPATAAVARADDGADRALYAAKAGGRDRPSASTRAWPAWPESRGRGQRGGRTPGPWIASPHDQPARRARLRERHLDDRPVIVLGGSAYAAATLPRNSVGSAQIKRNAVTAAKVKDRSLIARDFKAGQLPRGAQGQAARPGRRVPPARRRPGRARTQRRRLRLQRGGNHRAHGCRARDGDADRGQMAPVGRNAPAAERRRAPAVPHRLPHPRGR